MTEEFSYMPMVDGFKEKIKCAIGRAIRERAESIAREEETSVVTIDHIIRAVEDLGLEEYLPKK